MYPFFSADVFGIPAETANWIATGVAILVLLFVLYLIYRIISQPRLASGRRSKHARLAITDAASVDEKRRLVLVRRDDVEHLILIGGANDLIIESDIRKNAPARPIAQNATATTMPPTAPATAPSGAQPPASPASASVMKSTPAPRPVEPHQSTPPAPAPVASTPNPTQAPTVAPPRPVGDVHALSTPMTAQRRPVAAPASPEHSTAPAAQSTQTNPTLPPRDAQMTTSAPAVTSQRQEPHSLSDDMDALLNEITNGKT